MREFEVTQSPFHIEGKGWIVNLKHPIPASEAPQTGEHVMVEGKVYQVRCLEITSGTNQTLRSFVVQPEPTSDIKDPLFPQNDVLAIETVVNHYVPPTPNEDFNSRLNTYYEKHLTKKEQDTLFCDWADGWCPLTDKGSDFFRTSAYAIRVAEHISRYPELTGVVDTNKLHFAAITASHSVEFGGRLLWLGEEGSFSEHLLARVPCQKLDEVKSFLDVVVVIDNGNTLNTLSCIPSTSYHLVVFTDNPLLSQSFAEHINASIIVTSPELLLTTVKLFGELFNRELPTDELANTL